MAQGEPLLRDPSLHKTLVALPLSYYFPQIRSFSYLGKRSDSYSLLVIVLIQGRMDHRTYRDSRIRKTEASTRTQLRKGDGSSSCRVCAQPVPKDRPLRRKRQGRAPSHLDSEKSESLPLAFSSQWIMCAEALTLSSFAPCPDVWARSGVWSSCLRSFLSLQVRDGIVLVMNEIIYQIRKG